MKKKPVAACALLVCIGSASAQSSVTIFGVLDAAVSHYTAKSIFYNNTSGAASPAAGVYSVERSQTVLSNSGQSNSRLGFRGTEDLGGGLAAGFWLEAPLANDNGNAFPFTRRSTVSLSGAFGEVRLGRDFTPTFWNDSIFSPFSTIGVGANVVSTVSTNLATARGPGSASAASDNYLRTSNSIGYFLPPNLGGVYGQLQFALHENVKQDDLAGSPSRKGQYAGGRLGYASGPLDMAVAYGSSTASDATGISTLGQPTGVNSQEKLKTLNLGASYNLGFLKLYAELSKVTDAASATTPLLATSDKDTYKGGLLGVTVPFGPGQFKAAYSRVKFDNDLGAAATPLSPSRNATVAKLAVGYEHNLSKRTALYATAAWIHAKDAQNNPTIMGATTGTATYQSTGAGVSGYAPSRSTGYDIGIRHTF